MPATRKLIPGEKIAEAKHLYERTLVPVDDIAVLLAISRRTLTNRIKEWGWKKRRIGAQNATRSARPRRAGARVAAVPQVLPPNGAGEVPASGEERRSRAQRIQAVVEREIDAVEQILHTLGVSDTSETETAARTLASLARTLRELIALDAPPMSDAADDRTAPRDIDELRRSLSEKLERIIAERADEAARAP